MATQNRCAVKDAASIHSDALALQRMLGREIYGAYQRADGSYPGRQSFVVSDLEAHFRGDLTIAIACVRNRRGNALIFDLDERFEQRLPLIGAELERRGLASATICTSGSGPGRGKVLVFFESAKSQRTLVRLGRQIRAAAERHPAWGIAPSNALSIFPTLGEGGLVRIGGANRSPRRNAGILDVFFSLDGEPKTLSQVAPARRLRMGEIGRVEPAPQHSWVERYLSSEWTYNGGSKAVFARFIWLAGEAWRLYGSAGHDALAKWAFRIWQNSPEMRGPSPGGDDRTDRSWDRRWREAWAYIVRTRTAEMRSDAEVTISIPGATYKVGLDNVTLPECDWRKRILRLLRSYCEAKGVTPDAVAISYRQLAEIAGWSAKTTWQHVQALVAEGRLVIHDRGTRGPRGLPVILGIVERCQSADDILERGRKRGNVRMRAQWRAQWAAQSDASLESGTNADSKVVEFAEHLARRTGRARVPANNPVADVIMPHRVNSLELPARVKQSPLRPSNTQRWRAPKSTVFTRTSPPETLPEQIVLGCASRARARNQVGKP